MNRTLNLFAPPDLKLRKLFQLVLTCIELYIYTYIENHFVINSTTHLSDKYDYLLDAEWHNSYIFSQENVF